VPPEALGKLRGAERPEVHQDLPDEQPVLIVCLPVQGRVQRREVNPPAPEEVARQVVALGFELRGHDRAFHVRELGALAWPLHRQYSGLRGDTQNLDYVEDPNVFQRPREAHRPQPSLDSGVA